MARTKGATGRPRPTLNGVSTPMSFLQRVMDDDKMDMQMRVNCAISLMPFQHKRLPVAIEVDASINYVDMLEMVIVNQITDGT